MDEWVWTYTYVTLLSVVSSMYLLTYVRRATAATADPTPDPHPSPGLGIAKALEL